MKKRGTLITSMKKLSNSSNTSKTSIHKSEQHRKPILLLVRNAQQNIARAILDRDD